MSPSRNRVVAADLPAVLGCMRDALILAREEIDALNVFPVPDGDTGTNLVTTVTAACEGVAAVSGSGDDARFAEAAARGALRGAVGNSGVIISQFVRAVAEALADHPVTVGDVPDIFAQAHAFADDAVADPLDGTILSVMAVAAIAAHETAEDATLADAVARILAAVGTAVAETRTTLPANRDADVVDAGARGFEVAVDGMLAFLEDRPLGTDVPAPIRSHAGRVVRRETGAETYAFEVQYLLETDEDVADSLRSELEDLGDSVVVVGSGGLVNVHVHTNEVDAVLDAGRGRGTPRRVDVIAFDAPRPSDGHGSAGDTPAVGFLAVVSGDGTADLVRAAGAAVVEGVAGGPPSVTAILETAATLDADNVVLLPGHPDVVAALQQARVPSAHDQALHVVEAADSVPAVLAALAMGPTDHLDLEASARAAGHVHDGEIVRAVAGVTTPVGPVVTGQYLAVVGGEVVAVTDDVVDAFDAVLAACVDADTELVTLIAGSGVDDDEERRVRDQLEDRCPRVDVEVIHGRQRPARWIVGAE